MQGNKVMGLRMFLSTLIDLISRGEKISCEKIEVLLASGIASKLFGDYSNDFERNEFNPDNIQNVDEYFKQWVGVADGEEIRKYSCKDDEGFSLVVKLALNEIF